MIELMKKQQRCHVGVELREEGESRVLTGKPIVYDSPSHYLFNYFRERIRPGAFDKFLRSNPDIMCLADHDGSKILGRTLSKTLRIVQSDRGISIECDAPRTTYAQDLVESIRRGDVRGMSFEFDVITDEWYLQDKVRCRDVIEAELVEFSYVSRPAYPATEVGLRDVAGVEAFVAARMKREDMTNHERVKGRLRLLQLG